MQHNKQQILQQKGLHRTEQMYLLLFLYIIQGQRPKYWLNFDFKPRKATQQSPSHHDGNFNHVQVKVRDMMSGRNKDMGSALIKWKAHWTHLRDKHFTMILCPVCSLGTSGTEHLSTASSCHTHTQKIRKPAPWWHCHGNTDTGTGRLYTQI